MERREFESRFKAHILKRLTSEAAWPADQADDCAAAEWDGFSEMVGDDLGDNPEGDADECLGEWTDDGGDE